MKKQFQKWQAFLMAALVCLSLGSCGGSDDDDEVQASTQLDVDAGQLNFSADGETQTFRVSSNTNWTITGNANWLTVSPASGTGNKSIVVTAVQNTTTAQRTCQLRVASDDGQASTTISVQQAAMTEQLSVDVSELRLDGNANSSGAIRITSNTAWTVSGAGSWLTLSSSSGNGTSQITVTANSANNSASARECTLTFASGQKTAQVRVLQNGTLASNCEVSPNTVVTLANGVATNFSFGSSVAYYHVRLFVSSLIERMTDAEIIAEMSADISDRDTPQDNYVTSWKNLSPLSEYTICTVGFDKDGNHGELAKTTVKTKSGTNQPLAVISDVQYNSKYWFWTTTVNGFVTKYYQWVVTSSSLHNSTGAAIAWFFKNAMDSNPDNFTAIAQGDSWQRERNGDTVFDVVTWAVGVDGTFSGLIDRFVGSVDSSAKVVKKVNTPQSQDPFKHYTSKPVPLAGLKQGFQPK